MALVARGDPTAQSLVVQAIASRTRTVARAVLGNVADGEDAAQSALLEVLESAGSYRGGNFFAWADRIAVRTAMRHARQRRVREARYDTKLDPETLTAHTSPAAQQSVPRPLIEYLSELPETRRVVLVLRHVMDYSIEEIAELTEVSPNTVKDRLLHAREQLRKRIRRDLAVGAARSRGAP